MTFTNRLLFLKSIVQYCDENECFLKIKEQCDHSQEQEIQSGVYIFPMDVNLSDLYEKSVALAEKILENPVESSSLFHEVLVVFEYIKCEGLLPAGVTSFQVVVKLCITDMPCIIQSTRYICSDVNCEGHYGNYFIRIHIPGASETQTVRSDFMCTICGGLLEEMISSRTLSDKMIAEVIPIKLEGHQRKESLRGQMTQAIPVIIRDELIDKIEIGKSYVIIGICRTDYVDEEMTVTLEANSIKEIKTTVISKPDVNVKEYLPNSIASIYHDCTPYPWRFVLHMAFHFASGIVPLGKMIKMRLLLLISLVLSPQENKLHILAIGNETEMAFPVMSYALQFSRRSSPASATTPFTGKVSNTKYPWTPYFIQGGSLLLSSGGVCSLGEIGMWKKARKEQLKTALISSKVLIELASKYTGSLPQMISLPLPCQIWSLYSTTISKTKTDNTHSNTFTGCCTGDLAKSFLDSFSIIAFLDSNLYSFDEDSDLQFLDMMWRSHCDDINDMEGQLVVDVIDFEKFLSLASQMDTQLSVEAEVLLHSYFSASRMARTSGCGGSDVPPSALITLTSLSVGIAKLQLHSVVLETDAVLAIYIYEEYLASRWGISVLSVQPQPDISYHEIDYFLGTENDKMIQQFSTRLQQFCTRVQDSISLKHLSSKEE